MTFRRDAYIAAAGCVAGDSGTLEENAQTLTCLALEMQKLCATLTAPDGSPVVMRIGLHCGPLVGGVVGGSMLRYHLFGSPMDAVTQVRTSCSGRSDQQMFASGRSGPQNPIPPLVPSMSAFLTNACPLCSCPRSWSRPAPRAACARVNEHFAAIQRSS